MGTFLQVAVTLIGSIAVALVVGWELALVTLATGTSRLAGQRITYLTRKVPFLVGAAYIRFKMLAGFAAKTKAAYEFSAQMACEATAAMRTVASLTLEEVILERYHKLLEAPLRDGYRNATRSTAWYAVSQSMNFLANGRLARRVQLIVWLSARLLVWIAAVHPYGIRLAAYVHGLHGRHIWLHVRWSCFCLCKRLGAGETKR